MEFFSGLSCLCQYCTYISIYICIPLYVQQVEALVTYIQTCRFLAGPDLKAFAQALVTNELKLLAVRPGTSGDQCVLVDITIHLAAVLLCGNQGILAPLRQLAMAPANMQVCTIVSCFQCWHVAPLFFEVN